MLASLTILGDTSFEFTSTSGDDKNSAVRLGSTSDHVLDEVTVSGSIDNLRRPDQLQSQGQITTAELTVTMYLGVSNFQRAMSIVIPRSRSAFSLSNTHAAQEQLIISHHLSKFCPWQLTVFEGTLAELSGFLLEFFNGSLVDTTALVDQVPSGGRFSGIDVTDDWVYACVMSDQSSSTNRSWPTYRQR